METGRQRHPRFPAPLQQCPGRAGGMSSRRRRERKRPILTLPAPGWQPSLLAAKPLGAASDWISQPGKCSKKGKGVETKIDKACQMAARKPRAGSRPEAKAGWAQRRLRRGDSRDRDSHLAKEQQPPALVAVGFWKRKQPSKSPSWKSRRDDFLRKTRQASAAFASVKFWILEPVFNYFFLPFFHVLISRENV